MNPVPPQPSSPTLSPLERTVIALSRLDTPSSLRPRRRATRWILGTRHDAQPLADPTLEALRRYAILRRNEGSPREMRAARERLHALGYPSAKVEMADRAVRASLAEQQGAAPHTGARPRSLVPSSMFSGPRSFALHACLLPSVLALASCASVPIRPGGALTSYEGMNAHKGRRSRAQLRVEPTKVLAARTVRIVPARFADGVGASLSDKERMLVANRIDRALCRGLARRLDVVGPDAPADLSIRTTITHFGKTNKIASAVSVITSFVSVVPVISPRVPFGLGSLGIEAEALDPAGQQDAAMLWTGKAQPIGVVSNASISRIGDAYQLSSDFGEKFGKLITTGRSPYKGGVQVKLPKLTGKKDADCEAFGKDGGLAAMVADNFGAPPGWTDKGVRKPKRIPASNASEANR